MIRFPFPARGAESRHQLIADPAAKAERLSWHNRTRAPKADSLPLFSQAIFLLPTDVPVGEVVVDFLTHAKTCSNKFPAKQAKSVTIIRGKPSPEAFDCHMTVRFLLALHYFRLQFGFTMPETAVMDTPEAASAPATPVTPAPAPAAAPAPEKLTLDTFERDSANLTPDALIGLTPAWTPPNMVNRGAAKPAAAPKAAAPAPATPAAPAPATPTEPAAAAPATSAPESTPAAPHLPEGVTPVDPNSPDHPKNWKMKAADAKEALFFQLRKSGVPINEAYAEVYGEQAAAAPAPAPATQPVSQPEPVVDPVAQADQAITALASQVAELEARIDEVAESDPKTALKLTRQQADLKLDLSNAKTQREAIRQQIQDIQVNQAVEAHRQLEQQSLGQMYRAYPQLNDPASEERAAFNIKVAQLEKDPAFGPKFRRTLPGWPLMVAQMVDAEKGWSRTPAKANGAPAPVANPASPARPSTPMSQPENPLAPKTVVPANPVPPVRATSAEVITPGSNSGSATPAINAESFWRDSANVPPAELIRLMGRAPIDPRLTRAARNDPRRFNSP